MTKMMLRSRNGEHGATGIEYGLIAALVAAVLIAIVSITGVNLSTVYCSVAGQVGVATGVDGACNDIGGGTDNPNEPGATCDADNNYAGDYSGFYWVRVDNYDEGVLKTFAAGRTEWTGNTNYSANYPASDRGALITEPELSYWDHGHYNSRYVPGQGWVGATLTPYEHGMLYVLDSDNSEVWSGNLMTYTQADATVLGSTTWEGSFVDNGGVQMDVPPVGADLSAAYTGCSGDGGNGGGNNDPNCQDGSFIGSTDDWYWKQELRYDNGYMTMDASGTNWTGYANGTYTWEERGAITDDPAVFATQWQKSAPDEPGPNNTVIVHAWTNILHFEHGSLNVQSMFDPAEPGGVYSDLNQWEPAGWFIQWNGHDILYPDTDKGSLNSTDWYASPDNNGGIQHGSSPAEPGDNVYYDYPCGGGEGPQ